MLKEIIPSTTFARGEANVDIVPALPEGGHVDTAVDGYELAGTSTRLPPATAKRSVGALWSERHADLVDQATDPLQLPLIDRINYVPIPGKLDLTPFLDLLVDGILGISGLLLADCLFEKVEPDDGGALARTTKPKHVTRRPHGVEYLFVRPTVGKTGGVQLGGTSTTLTQSVDRKKGGLAERITLSIFPAADGQPETGASLFTLKHERVHATDFQNLPQYYQIPFPDVPRDGTLLEIYKAILENLYYDEATAFMSEVALADNFAERTGYSIFQFRSHRPFYHHYEELSRCVREVPAHRRPYDRIYEHIANNPAYRPYKVLALSAAIHIKRGMADFVEWKDVLNSVGALQQDGSILMTPEVVENAYNLFIKPVIAKNFVNMAWTVYGVTERDWQNILRYFSGNMSFEEAGRFLEKDFDKLVSQYGGILDKPNQAENDALDPMKLVSLPLEAKPTPMRPDTVDEVQNHPRTARFKVELFGKYVSFLKQLDSLSSKLVHDNWFYFLTYAELADPESASYVYSRLMAHADQHVNEDPEKSFIRFWQLGLSLKKSGYDELASREIRRGIAIFEANPSLEVGGASLFPQAIELGLSDMVEECVDRVLFPLLDTMKAGVSRALVNRILGFIASITNGLSREVQARFSKSLQSKITDALERVHAFLKRNYEGRIKHYRQTHSVPENFQGTIDEMTYSVRGNPKQALEDSENLIGTGNHSLVMHYAALIEQCLRSPLLFELGLAFLEGYPESLAKSELYRTAAINFPEGQSQDQISKFVEGYRTCILNQGKILKHFNFEEVHGAFFYEFKETNLWHPQPPLPTIFNKTHFYWQHHWNMADLLMRSLIPELMAEGQLIVREFDEDPRFYSNTYEHSTRHIPYGVFSPAFAKAQSLFWSLDHFSATEKPRVLEQCIDLLISIEASSYYILDQYSLLFDLAIKAAELGLNDIARRAMVFWEESRKIADLKLVPPEIEEHKKSGFSSNTAETEWPKVRDRSQVLVPLLDAFVNSPEKIEDLIARVELSIKNNRPILSISNLLEAVQILSCTSLKARLETTYSIPVSSLIRRFALAVIDLYVKTYAVEQRGEKKKFFGEQWAPLVGTLKEMALDAPVKDEIFTYLIESATPESGVFVERIDQFGGVWQGLNLLDFVMGHADYPMAEEAILQRIGDGIRGYSLNRQDPRSAGMVRALSWIFKRVAHAGLLDPSEQSTLAGLNDDASYQTAVSDMFSFLDHQEGKTIDRGNLMVLYQEAMDRRDVKAIEELTPSLEHLVRFELHRLMDTHELQSQWRSGGRARKQYLFITANDLDQILAGRIYRDWKQMRQAGEVEMADKLIHLWAHANRTGEIEATRILFYEALNSLEVDIETKRALFQDLINSNYVLDNYSKQYLVSRYAEKKWKELVRQGDIEREAIFYEMFTPNIGVPYDKYILIYPKDPFLVLVFESPMEDLREIVKLYRLARQEGKTFQFDSRDVHALVVQLLGHHEKNEGSGWRTQMAYLFGALHVLKETISWDEYHQDYPHMRVGVHVKNLLVHAIPEAKALIEGDYHQEVTDYGLRAVLGQFSTMPGGEELDATIAGLCRIYQNILRSEDQIRSTLFKIPELFKNRDPLTQFMLSRFFMDLDLGEQNTLLNQFGGVSAGEALRAFFEITGLEKIGQFLSFLPDVPEAIRRELKPLQDRVKPTDFGLVRKWIMDQLGVDENHELIANLDRNQEEGRALMGSGTIGEAYRSALTIDGELREVVIKVIHEKKEEKFREALNRLQKVKYFLSLYADEPENSPYHVPNTRQALQFIEMFIQMVEKEMDLREEATHARQMKLDLSGLGQEVVDVPQYINDLTTAKVGVQLLVHGKRIDDILDKELRAQVILMIRGLFLMQVLQTGQYHSDLQPGNILVDVDESTKTIHKIWLIDAGQVGHLELNHRLLINDFMTAMTPENLLATLEQMAVRQVNYERDPLLLKVETLFAEWKAGADVKNLAPFVSKLFTTCMENGLIIDIPYLQLIKGLYTFEATATMDNVQEADPDRKTVDQKRGKPKSGKPAPPDRRNMTISRTPASYSDDLDSTIVSSPDLLPIESEEDDIEVGHDQEEMPVEVGPAGTTLLGFHPSLARSLQFAPQARTALMLRGWR